MMRFVVSSNTEQSTTGALAILAPNNWDDWYRYETLFQLIIFDENGVRQEIGWLKIGEFGMKNGRRKSEQETPDEGRRSPRLPKEFETLDDSFFSLGQDDSYYEALNRLGDSLRNEILTSLRDVANDLDLFQRARSEEVVQESLLRAVAADTVLGKFHRLAHGDAALSHFKFSYTFPPPAPSPILTSGLVLPFEVKPESFPPTNIHVLIGRNGVGKTRCLNRMTRAIVEPRAAPSEVGGFLSEKDEGLFANVVSVSFSAFDPFGPLPEPHAIPYSYIGLKRQPPERKNGSTISSEAPRPSPTTSTSDALSTKDLSELTKDFVSSVAKCRTRAKVERWHRALQTLEADPLFQAAEVSQLSDLDDTEWDSNAYSLFDNLSAGHKIVLLTITRLVEVVLERTLVLLDEPEAHLHPPLLAAFVRSLSDLLIHRNGVAVIATHSPVILQEAPKSCVWVLRRSGAEVRSERPDIETFGENVGVLTREVFGLEVTRAGFHKLLRDTVASGLTTYEAVLERFDHQLGAEARAILRVLVNN